MTERTTVGLLTFLKGSPNPQNSMPGCSNYDNAHDSCLFEKDCLVEKGQRCKYFEKAVLPTSAEIGLKETLYGLYEKQVGTDFIERTNSKETRRCPDCGDVLKPRRRYCDKCTKNHRKQAYRNRRQKQRFQNVSSATVN